MFLAWKATQANVYFKTTIKSAICAVIAAALPQKYSVWLYMN